MAKLDMRKYIDQAKEAGDAGEGGSFERWDPPEGWRGRCKVVRVNAKLSDKGEPQWGIWVEVIDTGEFQGKRFWLNANFSDSWAFITSRALSVLTGFGLSMSLIADAGDNIDLIASALEGKVGIVTAVYGKNKKNPDKPFANHTVAASKAPAPAKRQDDDEDDEEYDDDEGYDDEPEEEEYDDEEPEEEEPEEEEEEEPEPEPEPAPKRGRKPKVDPAYEAPAKKAPPKRRSSKAAAEDFED